MHHTIQGCTFCDLQMLHVQCSAADVVDGALHASAQARDGKRKRTFDPDTDICMGLLVLIQMDEEPNEYWDKPWSVGKVTE